MSNQKMMDQYCLPRTTPTRSTRRGQLKRDDSFGTVEEEEEEDIECLPVPPSVVVTTTPATAVPSLDSIWDYPDIIKCTLDNKNLPGSAASAPRPTLPRMPQKLWLTLLRFPSKTLPDVTMSQRSKLKLSVIFGKRRGMQAARIRRPMMSLLIP